MASFILNTLNLVAHINKKTETWDILGKTTELGFLYRGKYKDCINDWFDCQRGRRDIQVSVGWSMVDCQVKCNTF